ncbi:hypothetical protein PFISCL1PPCAC_23035, partial [Pristionchus fissidentatus]
QQLQQLQLLLHHPGCQKSSLERGDNLCSCKIEFLLCVILLKRIPLLVHSNALLLFVLLSLVSLQLRKWSIGAVERTEIGYAHEIRRRLLINHSEYVVGLKEVSLV